MKYKIHNLGEFRMGAEGFGISFIFDDKIYDFLSDLVVFCNVTNESVTKHLTYSIDNKYLIVKGIFDTYVIDVYEREISLYKVTIRTNQIWSEETAVWGSQVRHINGGDGSHYYIQFPFVPFNCFNRKREEFETLRIKQLNELVKND